MLSLQIDYRRDPEHGKNRSEFVTQISRMEEVLSKHRKRNPATLGMDETDEDKMKRQLWLDVTGLKSHITELGLALPDSYNDLYSMVNSAYQSKK